MSNKPVNIPESAIRDAATQMTRRDTTCRPIAIQVLQRQAFLEGARWALSEMQKQGAIQPTTAKFV